MDGEHPPSNNMRLQKNKKNLCFSWFMMVARSDTYGQKFL